MDSWNDVSGSQQFDEDIEWRTVQQSPLLLRIRLRWVNSGADASDVISVAQKEATSALPTSCDEISSIVELNC